MTIEESMSNREGVQPGRFADRRDAGRQLAAQLLPLAGEHPLVVGLPRGGVPVASEIATALRAPLEILAVRKLGAPHNPEYGIGAIVEGRTRIFDPEALAALEIDDGTLRLDCRARERGVGRRVVVYRGGRPRLPCGAATWLSLTMELRPASPTPLPSGRSGASDHAA